MDDSEIDAGRILLAEYEQLKQEQRTRIGFRDNLVYATLASVAAIVAAVFSPRGSTAVLLATPPVCIVLGWTYLANDEKVSAIGRYLRDDLARRIAGRSSLPAGEIFAWETAHRADRRRASRKRTQLAVDVIAFCGTAAAALTFYWVLGPYSPALLVLSIAELVAVVVLSTQFVRYADVSRQPPAALRG